MNLFQQQVANDFSQLDSEESLNLKQEMFSDLPLQPMPSFQHQLPPVFTTPLKICNEEYSGPYNFEVSIIPNGTKNPWVVSKTLIQC